MAIDTSIYGQQQPPRFNTPFEVLGQMQQLQQQQQVIRSNQALEQERRAKLAEDQKKQADADQFSSIISKYGLFNRDAMRTQLQQHAPDKLQGLEDWYAKFDKSAEEYTKAKQESAAAAALAQQRQSAVVGTVANGIAAHGYTPTAFAAGLNELSQKFPESQQTWDNYAQLAQQNGPAWIKEHVDGLRSLTDLSTAAKIPGEEAVSKREQLVTAGTSPTGITAQQQAQNTAAAVTGAAATQNAATNAAREKRESQAANLGALVGEGTGPTQAPASGKLNEEYLASLPTPLADKAKALVEGRLQLPSRFTKGDTYWQSILDAATKYDPTFDAGNYNARAKARLDLTSPNGTGGKTINALNTAILHAGRLSDLIEAEDNYNSPAANAVVNPLRTLTGSSKVTNFQAVQPQFMKEIERAWRGAGGSSGDIQKLEDSLGKNQGKQQQRDALHEFAGLLEGKIQTTEQQRDNALGAAGQGIPVLYEQSKPVLDKIAKRAGGDSAAGQPAKGTRKQNSHGDTIEFDGTQWNLVQAAK